MKEASVLGISQALDTLLAEGVFVKIADQLYHDTQIKEIRGKLEEMLRLNGSVTPAQFRTMLGTSRKYAVPLLEWFDAIGVTERAGEAHVRGSQQE